MQTTQRNLKNHPTTGARPDAKPATIHLASGESLTVTHHFRSEDGKWIHAYETERASGIDYSIPRESIDYIDRGKA